MAARSARSTAHSRSLPVAALLVFLTLAPGGAAGQTMTGAGEGPQVLSNQAPAQERLLSISPVALVLSAMFAVDLEQAVGPGITVGPSLFYHNAGDRRYAPSLSVDGVFRYYPEGRAFSGWAVGALAGFTVMDDDGASRNAFGLGFTGEHHWLLGQDGRMAIAAGVGGKRLFYFSDRGDAWRALPLARLSLGWTF